MSTALEKDIYAYLKTRKSIKFKVVLNIQGGPQIFLKYFEFFSALIN